MQNPRRLLTIVAGFVLSLMTASFAAPGSLSVSLDGRTLNLEQAPIVSEGRVLVPLRGIFEGLGATVNYDAASHTIHATRGTSIVLLTVNSAAAMVNGTPATLKVPAQIVNGNTLVPLRFISESLGAKVNWVAAERTVYISQGDMPRSTSMAPAAPVVAAAPTLAISSVVMSSNGPFKTGDMLTVTLTGTPGATATFDLNGLSKGLSMQEVSSGQYQGKFTIPAHHDLTSANLVGHLALNGEQIAMAAAAPVTLATHPMGRHTPVVKLISPKKDEAVSNDFTVTGMTTPLAKVEVTAELRHHKLLILSSKGEVLTAIGEADADGHFSIRIHLGSIKDKQEVSLIVRATDSLGASSKPLHQNVLATGE